MLSVRRPARAGEIPARAVAKEIPDRDFTARAAASPLERPVSRLTPFSLSEMGFSHGLIFYPKLPFIYIAFISFQHRILFSLLCLMGFSLKVSVYGLIFGSRYLS